MHQHAPSQHSISESIQARDFDAVAAAESSAVMPLLQALRQRDRVVGQWAYQALRRLGKSAVPGLVRALNDANALIRRDAAHALERIRDRDATEGLIRALDDDDAKVRVRAVQALGQLGDDRAVDPLIRLLSDQDRAVAHHATNALTAIGTAAALPLIRVLEDHRHDEIVRWRAAYALRFIRTPQVRDVLVRVLMDQHQPSYVRQGAAVALGYSGDDQIVETLIEVLSDSDGAVRASGAHALGEYPRYAKGAVDKRPVEPLIRILTKDEDPKARWMAAFALQFFYDDRALPALLPLRHIPAISLDEKRIKEAAGFVVRNMRCVARRRAASVSAIQGNTHVP